MCFNKIIIAMLLCVQCFENDVLAQQIIADSIPPFIYTDTAKVDSAQQAEQLMQAAIAHYDGKRFNQSLQSLDKAIAINNHQPLMNVLYYYKALTLTQLEQYNEALTALDTAIRTSPQFKPNYYLQRAKLYIQAQNLANAKHDLEDIAAFDANAYEARTLLGAITLQQNNPQGAIWWLDQAVATAPNYAEAYYYRGFTQFQLLRPVQGCEDLRRAASLNYAPAQQAVQQYCK